MTETTLLEPTDQSEMDEKLLEKDVCGGRYTFGELLDTFSVRITDNPSPTPIDLIKANRKLSDLYMALSREKAIAQLAGRKSEVTMINTLLESLDYSRKCVHMMTWGRGIEAKVGTE